MTTEESTRLDIWLWRSRFFKTRALAGRIIRSKGVRVTRNDRTDRVQKPHFPVRVGDTLVFTKENTIRVVRVSELGHRRGPAKEAQQLYTSVDEETSD